MRDGTDRTQEMFPKVRQFSGKFFVRRRIAAADEVPAGIGGGGRRDNRIYFLGGVCPPGRGFRNFGKKT